MFSRIEKKRATRAAKVEKVEKVEKTRKAAAARRRFNVGIAAAVLIVSAILGGLFQTGHHRPTASSSAPDELPGLQVTSAPWVPEYANLPRRLAALALPPNGDESYHIHAHLTVYVDGKKVPVPANVGISVADQLESPMHTHDTSGVIHIEAGAPSDKFTLGAFFDLWGVRFSTNQLGIYRTGSGMIVQVFIDGHPVSNGPAWPLRPHDDIVVSYGASGSSPTTDPYTWSAGL